MKCVYCAFADSKVIDSRLNENGTSIRRRRECLECGKRFTSYETVEVVPLLVVKRDGSRQAFDPQKIKAGIVKACEKRPVTMAQINTLIETIEKTLMNTLDQEVNSKIIGDMIMRELKKIDEISYVRFAAVYRQFQDVTSFIEFIKKMD
ncbi:MAG: transcriptional regulator NrdR [Christensenellaceae bacterium]|jgi:transcriptional repressor NrdR|nr:transcriptional regulator NrdR [Christensenellaceae bacterium]